MGNKVEICGVDTSKIPLLSPEEKRELLIKIKKRRKRSKRRIYKWKFKISIKCNKKIL